MDNYQIKEIVDSAVSNLSKAAEVNAVIGQPLVTNDGTMILPMSEVTFGFFAGGGEYDGKKQKVKYDYDSNFAGGTGGGASMTPVGFLVVDKDGVRVLKMENESATEKIIDIAKNILKQK